MNKPLTQSNISSDSLKNFKKRSLRSNRIKKHITSKWTNNEYTSLIDLVQNNGEDWQTISNTIKNKTPFQCMQKFKNSQRSAKKGNWLKKEDTILLTWVKKYGATKWTECSKLIKGRCGKQCRERWVNILNPKVKKGNWSSEEQNNIFNNLSVFFTSWSSMSKLLPGRTENSIKNYFYSSVRRIKSNPIIKVFKDIYVNGNKSFEFFDNLAKKNFIEEEIKKFNILSQSICRYLLNIDNIGKGFCNFLISILLINKKSKKIRKKKIKKIIKQGIIIKNENIISSPSLYIPKETNNIPILNIKDENKNKEKYIFSEKNEKSHVIEILDKFLNENRNENESKILNFLQNVLKKNKNVTFLNQNGQIKVKLPVCWNCYANNCLSH